MKTPLFEDFMAVPSPFFIGLFVLATPAPSAFQGMRGRCRLARRKAPIYLFLPFIMDDKQNSLGLTKLLDEISRDLDELRKKHPSDHNIKNITMWWELEMERVLARHMPGSVVQTLARFRSMKRILGWFTAGWLTMIAIQIGTRLFFQ